MSSAGSGTLNGLNVKLDSFIHFDNFKVSLLDVFLGGFYDSCKCFHYLDLSLDCWFDSLFLCFWAFHNYPSLLLSLSLLVLLASNSKKAYIYKINKSWSCKTLNVLFSNEYMFKRIILFYLSFKQCPNYFWNPGCM